MNGDMNAAVGHSASHMNGGAPVPFTMPSTSSHSVVMPPEPNSEPNAFDTMNTLRSTLKHDVMPAAAQPRHEMHQEMPRQMGDGDAMADMSNLHHGGSNQMEHGGFMDEASPEESMASQMNTVSKGLDMMATVASFLMEDDDSTLLQTQPAAPANPGAPFYNQYSPQTTQPQPLPGMAAPPASHPYGLPYFHRDPFMPLQTPYYHIPTFDNPQRNPALTPYYNPYVNPPPPVPPSVPAAPSFFPFHHPQHIIPPYFPYPAAPVLQPGAFPPYALPSHLAPGEHAPSAEFSKLPATRTDDPF
jgi:hypothetical protein